MTDKIDRIIELDIAFDVIDAAIHRCLGNNVRGFVDFEREEPTRATKIYAFSQYQLGYIGRIRIDKLGSKKVMLSFYEILEPLTPKQQREILDSEDILKKNMVQTIVAGLAQGRSFIDQRKKHYTNVIDRLFYLLEQQNIWTDEPNQKILQTSDSSISIGKNVTDSTVINGSNNVIQIVPKKSRKKS